MGNELTVPKTLQEAIIFYANPDRCLELLINLRWQEGVTCPYCAVKDVTFMASVRRWQCKNKACRKQFSIKNGTVMEDSPIGLDKWLCAIWLITNAKNGISSYEIHRAIGVTQKTAWFLLHRIRLAMQNGTLEKMSGTVEADETFIGGLEKNKHEDKKLHKGRGSVGKTAVMGILERAEDEEAKSKVRAKVIHDTGKKTLHAEIKKEVTAFSELYTDAWKGYRGLSAEYIHKFVDHAVNYALGQVHTNGLENFWALLKRCLKGTYISVEPFHLFRYLDEQVFRFNNRGENDRGRFLLAVGAAAGKRLTYAELTSFYLAYYDEVMPRQ